MSTWTDAMNAFRQAATWFAETVPEAEGRWDEPALGEWSVRDLVGHTSRALLTVEAYLDQPAEAVQTHTPQEYLRKALGGSGTDAAVARRGREAGLALGDDVPGAVSALTRRVLVRVDTADGEELVTTPAGGMRLVDYLPTRSFELTVHTCDLVAALGHAPQPPPAAVVESLQLVAALAAESGHAGALLRAATGRGGLPDGFTVL